MSYRKVGGIHFVKVGKLGFSFYVSKADATFNGIELRSADYVSFALCFAAGLIFVAGA